MGLSKRYGAEVAVRQVSFSVRAGEVFAFRGPNGAGKTTTIKPGKSPEDQVRGAE
ncbi:ATP-binding cassette domain-containing protein [Streptomyces sp. NPDC052101]|uniref:ATP-binding cassette domain-containing protein n=1 Tax=Streptomyces sp. NPDC052101 TaxID=3155763 RepID=UPI00341EC07B